MTDDPTFARILRPGGFVALVWNQQDSNATPFMRGYAALLDTYALDYNIVRHSREDVNEDKVVANTKTLHVFQDPRTSLKISRGY